MSNPSSPQESRVASDKAKAIRPLALDAIEAMFDNRADSFCLVTSDSDFAYLCRKLRERGAMVSIVGESKTPDALRNASDQFFEWTPSEAVSESSEQGEPKAATAKPEQAKDPQQKPGVKRRPKFIIEAVTLLTSDTSEGKVSLGHLGQYLKRMDPGFSPNTYGHSGLLNMIKTYDLLILKKEEGGHWSVGLKAKADGIDSGDSLPASA